MNRIIKKLIPLILSAIMFSIPDFAANAASWVTVSSWAYNDVSNFTKEGLLPDSMEETADYTRGITRLQLAEIVYSVMTKTKYISDNNYGYTKSYQDTDSRAAYILASFGIMEGETSYEYKEITTYDDSGEIKAHRYEAYYFFHPERTLTREEMAAVAYRIIKRYCPYLLTEDSEDTEERTNYPSDFDEISWWAKESAKEMLEAGIITGMEDGRFAPGDELSIEQAVCIMYRLYNALPVTSSADGAELGADSEQTVRVYSNGLTETKKGNRLYIKDNDRTLMEFETDIYANIYAADNGGIRYAAAQNLYGTADVYNLDSGDILFKIPYPVFGAHSDCIITKSANIGPFTFGIYDYGGNELFKPEYSLSELDEIRSNGMQIPEDMPKEADGWIYYSNREDNGKLYRIDSNGENKQKLTDNRGFDIEYADGWLFYHVDDGSTAEEWNEFPLYCMRADGEMEQRLTDTGAAICESRYTEYETSEFSLDGMSMGRGDRNQYSVTVYNPSRTAPICHRGEWIYYLQNHSLWRVSVSEDNVKKEMISGGMNAGHIQFKDGIIYFEDIDTNSLYRYDGGNLQKLSGELIVLNYGFRDNELLITASDRIVYKSDENGIEADLDILQAKENFKIKHDDRGAKPGDSLSGSYVQELKGMSDEEYSLYITWEWSEVFDEYLNSDKNSKEILKARGEDGAEQIIGIDIGFPKTRIGNVLYFTDGDTQIGKEGSRLWTYDLDTGGTKTIANNLNYADTYTNAGNERWISFVDYDFNVRRYNVSDDTVTVVYPNNNLHRYGRTERMLKIEDGIYKVDTEGNYSFVMNDASAGYTYAENGAGDAVHF